ncbi:MAG: hypothetical protein F6K65_36725 [Moorea sp. SIO3C2]|nr:hypothetical protein [Moorena sp. SIO3C2]
MVLKKAMCRKHRYAIAYWFSKKRCAASTATRSHTGSQKAIALLCAADQCSVSVQQFFLALFPLLTRLQLLQHLPPFS